MNDAIAALGIADCLTGLKVIDLSRNLPGPFATRLLADLGADVTKYEPKSGDPARALGNLFDALNHGKACHKMDFKHPDDIAKLKSDIATADVMIDSFRPNVLEGMGLSPQALLAENPKLVIVSITGYGTTPNWADKAGHDINFMAMSGVLDQLKTASGEQAMPNVQFADLAGGSDTAVIALLAAVVNAKLTGKGRHIIISMTHSLYNHLVMPKATGKFVKALTQVTPTPEQDFLGGVLPCYRLYQTQDGRYMAVGSLELKFWQGLCQALDVNEHAASHWQMGVLPTHPQSQAAAKAIAQKFASQPLSHWQHYFTQFDVCVTPILTLAEAACHELFANQDEYGNVKPWCEIDSFTQDCN